MYQLVHHQNLLEIHPKTFILNLSIMWLTARCTMLILTFKHGKVGQTIYLASLRTKPSSGSRCAQDLPRCVGIVCHADGKGWYRVYSTQSL